MKRLFDRRYSADYVALAYLIAYYVWLFTRTPGTPMTAWIGDVSFYPFGLAVGWACLRNSRVPSLDRRTRLAWIFLGVNALLLWLIGTTWPRLVDFFGPGAWPSWIGPLEIFQHILLVIGLLLFPSRPLQDREKTRFRLDLGLVVIAGFVLAFHFGLRVSLNKPPVGPLWVGVAQSVLDWVVFTVAAVGVLHKRDATIRASLGFLLAANTLYLCANYVLASMDQYRLGDPVDGFWVAAWAFRWTAARFAWHRYRTGRPDIQQAPEGPAIEYRNAVFSHVMVAGALALLIIQVISGDRQFLSILAVSAAAMTALLLARQVVELRENRWLFESQVAQEARFRSLVQHSSDVVIIADGGGLITYVSPSASRVFGPGAIETGTPLSALFPPEEVPRLEPLVGKAGPLHQGRLQTRMVTGAGRAIEVEIAWSDLRDDPAVAGLVLTCRDVTERNELERQLRHAQKLDAVGHLAGGLAHDFNNVLTAIRGYTELLRDSLPPGSTASEDLGHIEQAVDRAAGVTRQLLAFSRKQAVQHVVLDLNRVLLDLRPLLRQLATDRIEVSVETDPDLWPVRADQSQVEQVIVNLATNARDAMPNGGLLQIATANRTLDAASPATGGLAPGDYAAIVVSDQGIGMTEEVRSRIFEPFFSTKPKGRGMGLGLAMVHGIITHSGGHVSVESRLGHGTTFTVLLPRTQVARPPATDQAVRPRGPVVETTPLSILLVDDEFGVRTVAKRLLEQAGHRVTESADGLEALTIINDPANPVDLLLTDLVMPGLHGRDLITRFRTARPGIPIICITGFAGEVVEGRGGSEGISAVISKPFSSDVLLRAVADAVRRRRASSI